MAGTGLYHMSRNPSSSASSLGSSSLPFVSAAFSPAAEAAAAARKRRRFIVTSFYIRPGCGQLGMQFALALGFLGSTQAFIQACQPVMRHRIFGVQLRAPPDLGRRLVEFALVFKKHAQLEMRLPELPVTGDGSPQHCL